MVVMMFTTIRFVSSIASRPMLVRLRMLRSTSSSIIPSRFVTELSCKASMADSMAVDTPLDNFSEQLGLAPSHIIPVRLAIMFFTA